MYVMFYHEALRNQNTGEVRVAFRTEDPEVFVVVKLFGDADEMFTLKIFLGSYEKIKAHWRTTKVHSLTGTERLSVAATIRKLLPGSVVEGFSIFEILRAQL